MTRALTSPDAFRLPTTRQQWGTQESPATRMYTSSRGARKMTLRASKIEPRLGAQTFSILRSPATRAARACSRHAGLAARPCKLRAYAVCAVPVARVACLTRSETCALRYCTVQYYCLLV